MSWHPSYETWVLAPDYAFAEAHLKPHFIDALVAHTRTVARLPAALPHASALQSLEAGLQRLRTRPLPPRNPSHPDLYFALQAELERDVGADTLAWLRLGLSRNDLDMTVYLLRARRLLLARISAQRALIEALLQVADTHALTVLIAQTHHQPGQPTTVGHYFAAQAQVATRDLQRALQTLARMDACPLGAAALAGSSHPLDRHFSAQALGFAAPTASTYDAVAGADWITDIASVAQSVALNTSRLLHDLIAWASSGHYRLPDALVQGSSIMPQKRNPVSLEHARTRCSRALGLAQTLMLSLHNIPYGDHNDFGPDAQGALQSLHMVLEGALELTVACLREGEFNRARLEADAAATDTTATELADELVRGFALPFPRAHAVVGALLRELAAAGRTLQSATPDDLTRAGGPSMDAQHLADALSPAAFVARRQGVGAPGANALAGQLNDVRTALDGYNREVRERAERMDAAEQQLRSAGKDG